ncbi:MAG TPA: HAMP domain-containing sensor histidine kinase [Vicinamibacterales bacterium]|nr:HAMP domain-containing sensor histidine kinase [Vicinamibacterales bacterium]
MGAHPWRRARTRARFVRRLVFMLAIVLLFSLLGLVSLVSSLAGVRAFQVFAWRASSAAVALLGGIALFAFLFVVIRRVGRPLGDIVDAANHVADGDFSVRLPEYGPPSVRVVGRAFNTMAARLASQEQQRRHLMADIAHELRTPLAVIQGRLEGFLDGVYQRDDGAIEQVLEETKLLARLVEDLRTLANAEGGTLALHKEATDLGGVAGEVVNGFSAEAERRQVTIHLQTAADLPSISIDPLRIREVLANLLSNALQHTPAGGSVSIGARRQGERVVVTVADTGAGIAADDLPRIFDRFHKGRTSRGSGLGLTIARNVVEAHGGEISADSRSGHGTTITFTLPAPSQVEGPAPSEVDGPAPSHAEAAAHAGSADSAGTTSRA